MSDTEPSTLPQELVGVPKEDTAEVKDLLEDTRIKYRECLAPIIVERDKLDPRVLEFEDQLQRLNKDRADFYGREYSPPEIYYVDRAKAWYKSVEINRRIKAIHKSLPRFDRGASGYIDIIHICIIFVHNFDDPEVDGWDNCRKLRHELSHAGSVRKHRVYPNKKGTFTYNSYRLGAQILSNKRGFRRLGLAIDEGHHAIEDEIFEGLHPELLEQDENLKSLPNGQQLFPGAKQKYEQLRQQAIQQGEIKQGQMLVTYRRSILMTKIGIAELYGDYSKLMLMIYQRKPELFKLVRDFIYGDKIVTFTKEVEQLFSKGFFQKLMVAENRETTIELIKELE